MNKKLFERILDLSGQPCLSESYPFKQNPLIREEDDLRNIISFDFDDTLQTQVDWETFEKKTPEPIYKMVNLFKELSKENDVYIVSSRADKDREELVEFARDHNLDVKGVYTTNLKDKVDTLLKLGVSKHFDDDEHEINLCKQNGIEGVLVD